MEEGAGVDLRFLKLILGLPIDERVGPPINLEGKVNSLVVALASLTEKGMVRYIPPPIDDGKTIGIYYDTLTENAYGVTGTPESFEAFREKIKADRTKILGNRIAQVIVPGEIELIYLD